MASGGWRAQDERDHRSLPPRSPGTDDPAGADALLTAFAAWAAGDRAAQAARSRSRERWLRQQGAESATLVGALVDLAERRADATLVVGARHVTGRLVGVGRDGCLVEDRSGRLTVVAAARIEAVRLVGPERSSGAASGRRGPAGQWTVVNALEALAAERSSVRLELSGGETVRGELVSAGEDVLTVRTGTGTTWTHVALSAVDTCTPSPAG